MGDSNGLSSRPGAISIGNYKGVMLCNRPFAGVSAAAKKSYNAGKASVAPFLSAGQNRERLGLNPIRNPPNVIIERSKKDTALSKHKQFLSDLKKQKNLLQEELLEQMKAKEEKRNRFREKWRLKREVVVRQRRELRGEGKEDDVNYSQENNQGEEKEREAEDEAIAREEEAERQRRKEERRKAKEELDKKPKWALTEDAVEELEDIEADELLDFAKDLDFDGFLNDLEVRAALKAAKSRIDRIKEEKASEHGDESKISDSDSVHSSASLGIDGERPRSKESIRDGWRARKKTVESKEPDWDTRTTCSKDIDDDARSIASARSILSNSSVKSLKQIHSARSIAKITERIQKETPVTESTSTLRIIEEEENDHHPRIVSIYEDDRSRLTKKDETYNLPYMHRNPAV